MSDIFSAAGSIAAAAIQADAIKSATDAQIDALERQRDFVYKELEPSKVGGQALSADVQRAQGRLALQGVTDPALLAARYAAQNAILQGSQELGTGSPADIVARVAASEAVEGAPRMEEAKNRLIDQAFTELDAGATLPPDVQAEIVKAGLERSGQTVGSASGSGISGTILRKLIGQEGIRLQAERQQRAAALIDEAAKLEQSRQQVLGSLFPNLSAMQLNTLAGQRANLAASQELLPQAGLSGSDVANLWLARVGATNQLASQAANIGMQGGLGAAQAWGQGLSTGFNTLTQPGGTASGWINTAFGI